MKIARFRKSLTICLLQGAICKMLSLIPRPTQSTSIWWPGKATALVFDNLGMRLGLGMRLWYILYLFVVKTLLGIFTGRSLFTVETAQFPHRPHYSFILYYPDWCLYTVSLYSSLTSTNSLHGVSTPEGCFPLCVVSCGFLPLTSSPDCWPLGCQPQMVNYLLSEPWSPPLRPSSITLYQRQPIELPLSPPGCPTTWLITIHAAANPAEPRHQYSCLQDNIN